MADDNELQEGLINPPPEEEETPKQAPGDIQNTAADWVRDMRMSAAVNKTTMGVETERVTPDLLLAASRKLLKINRREAEQDPKDSLEFQRIYGPQEYFSEHILRDGDRVARQLLWKATNKGNLDFMPVGALDQHVSQVFNNSKLANMVDASSPLETVDAAFKITRIGEGGVADISSAPDEMRLVQPSFLGYIDAVRSPECYAEDTELMTEQGWKRVDSISCNDRLACLIDGRIEFHYPESMHTYAFNGLMYGYEDNKGISYLVTPNHRMWSRCTHAKRDGMPCKYNIRYAEDVHGKARTVRTGGVQPVLGMEDLLEFALPGVDASLKHPQVHGNPPQGANLKLVKALDIGDFAEFLGWYLAEGSFVIDHKKGYYRADISQSRLKNGSNFRRIQELVRRLPFGYSEQEHKSLKTVFICRKQVVMYLEQFGKSADKFIPEWLFTAPVEVRKRFRSALLAGDGRGQRHLCTISHRLAKDFERLQFGLGESVTLVHEPETRIPGHPGIWVVYWHLRTEAGLQTPGRKKGKGIGYFVENYSGTVYCPTVPGGLVYCRRNGHVGFWCGNSLKVGLDAYIAKNVMKGSDGKLYQRFINAHTGKEELVDSVTAAKSIVTTPDMMKVNASHCFAVGGKTGVRIVKKSDVDYYLPHMDEAFSAAANMVTGMSGVKEMRLLMGCLHPLAGVLTVGKRNEINICYAKDIGKAAYAVPSLEDGNVASVRKIRAVVAKLPPARNWFRKVVLYSGRTMVTSRDHRWTVLRKNKPVQVKADRLKRGDLVFRSVFVNLPNRRTFINQKLVNKDMATLLGYAVRTLSEPEQDKLVIQYQPKHREALERALARMELDASFYSFKHQSCLTFRTPWFVDWLRSEVGVRKEDRRVPSVMLSACADVAASFMDAFSADETLVGVDGCQYIWLLELHNNLLRDGIALLLNRLGTDTWYRDAVQPGGERQLALKLVPMELKAGDFAVDKVKCVMEAPQAPVMIDLDLDDGMFAASCGLVTHNSKYPMQAVSLVGREAPLVDSVDSYTGKNTAAVEGRYFGARFAKAPGRVTAVRQDRIDVLYDDGTKASVALYKNFPMNAKGFITNKPEVKAGDRFDKGSLLASSNYTDSKGVSAPGTNLRTAWISWKGGTYEDAVVLSESAAKKMTATTMYSNNMDLDKSVTLGKKNYLSWKPGEYSKEQLSALDDDGVVKPGAVLHQGDPMVLAVQTAEPSPGTLGKRILSDVSQVWEHQHEGVVTDVVKTRNGIKVLATVTAPVEIGDKVSGRYGNKGVVSKILPDDQMPQDKDGNPMDMLLSPLGLVSRCNPAQLHEALLGKVARKTGNPQILPAFYDGNLKEYVADKLKKAHIEADDDLIDPDTGRKIPGVVNGVSYIYRLKHMAESKLSARGTDEYSSDETPGGSGYEGSKRFGTLEQGAMVGHAAFQNILDAKLIRGQSNAEFWRDVRTGGIPVIPGEPLVHKKFFAHLQGSGVNVRKTTKGISVFALSNSDVNEMSGGREVKTRDTYEAKNFRPIDGGLFGQDVFGVNGDKWGYIQLDTPLPNPVMEEPLSRLLRMSEKDFAAVVSGAKTVNGMSSSTDIKKRLEKIDLEKEAAQALQEFKNSPASKKDAALKRYVAVEEMRRQKLSPAEYMLDKIPVLPPVFRPISMHGGTTMVADANYLYAQLLDARDDARDAKTLPKEYQDKAAASLYRTWKELTGLYDPEDVKLRNKNVGGLLKWALGTSPKFSGFQRKVLGSSVDTVGRGAIIPNSKLTIDQIGLPVPLAMDTMAPFVERVLVNQGYTPIAAMKMVKQRSRQAMEALQETIKKHPVQMNRAPSLHKYNIMAFEPVLVQGNAIQIHPSVCPGFAADFDGDSLLNTVRIVLDLKKLKEKFKKVGKKGLTSLEYGVYSAFVRNQGDSSKAEDSTMISKDTKCMFATATGSLSELPVVEGSEVQKSPTVTEWDVQDGFYVDTVDPVSGTRTLAKIDKVSRHTGLRMFDCSLSSSGDFKHIVTASEDHSLITLNPSTVELEKTRPEEAVGRLVPRVVKNKGNDWQVCSKYIKLDKDYPASYEMGMFIGLMLGDGWVNCQNLAFIACCDKSLQDYILKLVRIDNKLLPQRREATLQQYGPTENRFSGKARGRIALYIDWDLATALRKEIGDGAYNKKIPEDCMLASRAHLTGILMGLLATDGTVNYSDGTKAKKTASKTILFHTTSHLLRDGVQELCTRLGIKTGVTKYRGINSKVDCYAVSLSIMDVAKEVKKHPKLFRIPMESKQKALERIVEGAEGTVATKDSDIVPFPSSMRCEFVYAGINTRFKDSYNRAIERNYVGRRTAVKMLTALLEADWDKYHEKRNIYARHRTHHTPEQAKVLVDKWAAVVRDTSVAWETVDSVTQSTCTEGWDCTVPGPYTFTLSTGTVVQDTVNIHVPVSDNARKEARERMLPSRNLIGLAEHKIMNKPEKEYMQGLYIATRMGRSMDGRARIFRTLEEARAAYRKGEIDVDSPIQILQG